MSRYIYEVTTKPTVVRVGPRNKRRVQTDSPSLEMANILCDHFNKKGPRSLFGLLVHELSWLRWRYWVNPVSMRDVRRDYNTRAMIKRLTETDQ